jgi:predicted AlkP superfamily phosphohydrolase/phosphomutase
LTAPVIAIGLDALPPELFEAWTSEGKLPFLARMMAEGTYARQQNFTLFRTENSWLTLLQGCDPESSHEWGHQDFDNRAMILNEHAAYSFHTIPPFYALDPGKRVAVFDLPLTRAVPGVNGVQLLGWGTEVNQILRESVPEGRMDALIARHGRHPLYDMFGKADSGGETLSYRMPSVYDLDGLRAVRDALVSAVRQRTGIIAELLREERWDLLMAVYAEIHTAGHLLWHVGRTHPIALDGTPHEGEDHMLDVMQAIDAGLAELHAALPAGARFVLFSPHGMQANSLDLNLTVLLPEILYRWSTGNRAFADPGSGLGALPARSDFRRHWSEEMRELVTDHGRQALALPELGHDLDDPLDWNPASWYRPQWPRMKAFALPGYSEGLVRVNVAGRDGDNGIAPEAFVAPCDELVALLEAVVDPRSGKPQIDHIIRVRSDPFAQGEDETAADLIVVWEDDLCTDMVSHSELGTVGPTPYFRTGGHSTRGFVCIGGDGVAKGERTPMVRTEDVTATLLDLIGVQQPAHMTGTPMRWRATSPAAA